CPRTVIRSSAPGPAPTNVIMLFPPSSSLLRSAENNIPLSPVSPLRRDRSARLPCRSSPPSLPPALSPAEVSSPLPSFSLLSSALSFPEAPALLRSDKRPEEHEVPGGFPQERYPSGPLRRR